MSSKSRDIPQSYPSAKPRDSSTPLGMTTGTRPRRRLGLFDATMIVMGGIVGAGIFANPSEVAHRVHTPFLILSVWVLGGLIAMCGAFIWAELATRLPAAAGGQYVYLREAYHPAVAFMYGWGLLLVTQTGGMAAVAVIFASYFRALTGANCSDSAIAAITRLANRRGWRRGSLSCSESRVLACARLGRARCNNNSCFRCRAHGAGRARRAMDCSRDYNFHSRISQPKHANSSTRVLRHGARRPVLCSHRQALVAFGSAGTRDHAPRHGCNRHRLFRNLWRNFKLRSDR